jgi:hypothetical protein
MMSIGLQLHFDPVPGTVSSTPLQTVLSLLSQLVQVPTSAIPLSSLSAQVIVVVKVNVVNTHVPPPPSVQGAVTAFPHGSVVTECTSPHASKSAS